MQMQGSHLQTTRGKYRMLFHSICFRLAVSVIAARTVLSKRCAKSSLFAIGRWQRLLRSFMTPIWTTRNTGARRALVWIECLSDGLRTAPPMENCYDGEWK